MASSSAGSYDFFYVVLTGFFIRYADRLFSSFFYVVLTNFFLGCADRFFFQFFYSLC
ncbi:uncharacterized protein DS421_12g366920 [Arachis hypogaea]|nr:uncharacterized protein DS421_12g366920 [Arachis hypogaea]